MAYSPAKIQALPKRFAPGMILDCDNSYISNLATGHINCSNYADYVGLQGMANLLGGMGAGLNQAFQPPQQFQQLPERRPLPVEPQKKAHYSYELIQDVKAGVPFVVPRLFSANETTKQGEKSPTAETVLHAPSLAEFG